MKKLAIMRKLLELAVEDYYALWELRLEVKGVYPEKEETEVLQIAEDAVQRLLSQGWIKLFIREGSSNEVPLEIDKIDETLTERNNWYLPKETGRPVIVVGATKKGENAYYEQKL